MTSVLVDRNVLFDILIEHRCWQSWPGKALE
jgi:hypothetical protein